MISFIIPVYNSEKTVSECIESVLSQKLDKEIIVVDNGSTDSSPQLIKKYDVKYFYEHKKGPAAARNRGLKELNQKSKFVAFIDSDVILPADWSEKAIKLLEKYEDVAGVGGPGKSVVKNSVSEAFDYLLLGRNILENLKFVTLLATMNVMYKRQSIEDLFFDESLITPAAEDSDFNFRVIQRGFKLIYSNDLWVYHHNPTTIREVSRKWYNYGKYYFIPYFRNRKIMNLSLWLRILFLPLLLLSFLFSLLNLNYIFISLFILNVLPISYCILALKFRIKNLTKILIFSYVHSIKQLSQILGIYRGIISLMMKLFRKFRYK